MLRRKFITDWLLPHEHIRTDYELSVYYSPDAHEFTLTAEGRAYMKCLIIHMNN